MLKYVGRKASSNYNYISATDKNFNQQPLHNDKTTEVVAAGREGRAMQPLPRRSGL